MRLAYLINQYPAVSHTFIRREICALEKQGHRVARYALRPGNNLVDADDFNEKRKTRYILQSGLRKAFCSSLLVFARSPLAWLKGLAKTLHIGWRSERGVIRHLAYFVEASIVVRWCEIDAVEHIHAHFGTNSTTVAMLASQISAIPYSFTAHGPEEFDKATLIGLREKISSSAFTVAVTSFGRSQLFRHTDPDHWNKIKIVRCGIERTDVIEEKPRPNRFVCVGRLSEQKGHLLLIEAARLLVDRGRTIEIVLAGDGELRPIIEQFVSNYKLQNTVSITGWLDGAGIRRELLASRAMIQPSFAEGLPVAIMEAMALRRPVISTYIAGIPELVRPGIEGWLVPAGDAEALAEAIDTCLQTPATKLMEMGEAGRSRVYDLHDIAIESLKLSKLFEG